MRVLKSLVALSCLLGVTSVMADLKIAVLNVQQALNDTEAAKRYTVDSEKKFSPKIKEIQKIEAEAKSLQDKFAKDGEKMAQDERERIDLQFKQKVRDIQMRTQELNAQKQEADNETLQKLKPNLDKAITEVIKQGNYDLVLDRGALIYVKDGTHDITAQVTERMNKLK